MQISKSDAAYTVLTDVKHIWYLIGIKTNNSAWNNNPRNRLQTIVQEHTSLITNKKTKNFKQWSNFLNKFSSLFDIFFKSQYQPLKRIFLDKVKWKTILNLQDIKGKNGQMSMGSMDMLFYKMQTKWTSAPTNMGERKGKKIKKEKLVEMHTYSLIALILKMITLIKPLLWRKTATLIQSETTIIKIIFNYT